MSIPPPPTPDSAETVRLALIERVFVDFEPDWIVHEDADLIVVDKPAGVACQAADPDRPDDLVLRLRRYLASREGVALDEVYLGVHQRLDRDTSGLLVYTRRPEANPPLARQFEQRTLAKGYVAVVHGPVGGKRTLQDRLTRERSGRMRVVPPGQRGGKLAVTGLIPSERVGERSLVSLVCKTGRTHQLRVQLANAGIPIAGDRWYDGPPAARLMLHAARLGLTHPSGEPLSFERPPPPAFRRHLRGESPFESADAVFDVVATALQARWGLARAQPTAGEDGGAITAFRLVHGEADGLPGVAIDVYDRWLVLHAFELLDEREAMVVEALSRLGFAGLYLKRHPRQKNEVVDARDSELCPSTPVWGEAAPEELVVREYGVPFGVRLGEGFRTGLFLDQRDNRRRVAALAPGRRVLNLFAYTGGFSVAALAAGAAHARCVDASEAALGRARDNAARVFGSERHRTWAIDAFAALDRLARGDERFDVIVLDPPSYATAGKRRFRVTKDYADLVARSVRVLAPGGHLLACVNHHRVSQHQLRGFVHRGAETAGASLSGLKDLPSARDFPPPPGGEPLAKSVLATRR